MTATTGNSTIDIALTGQTLMMSDIRTHSPAAVAAMKPLLKGDVIFTNFENSVAEPSEAKAAPQKGLGPDEQLDAKRSLYAVPATVDVVAELGFNLVALSNNHIYDLGEIGLVNAVREFRTRGIANAGAGMNLDEAAAPGYLETPKGIVALVGMASGYMQPDAMAGAAKPGVNVISMEGKKTGDCGQPRAEDTQRILNSIREAATKADLVITYQHNHVYPVDGIMMMREQLPMRLVPPDWIKTWAHQQVDAGADMVVFQGTPLLKGIEIYRGKPIFYGLGNFVFNLPLFVDFFEPIVFTSVVPNVEFEGKDLKSISLRPIILNALGEGEGDMAVFTRGLPQAASGERAGYILQRIVDLSRPLGTEIEISGDAARVNLDASAAPELVIAEAVS
jgi:poly-gamma-glutamate synthesis protein (capsule biosynthesis protein)